MAPFNGGRSQPIVVEQDSFLTEFLFQNLVLGTQVFDHFLLLAIDTARKNDNHQMPWLQSWIHGCLGDRAKLLRSSRLGTKETELAPPPAIQRGDGFDANDQANYVGFE